MTLASNLFERHATVVYRFFLRMGCPYEAAEELTQEVFLRVLESLHRYEPRGRELGWLMRIARNVLADSRKDLRKAPLSLDDVDEPSQEPSHLAALSFYDALRLLPEIDREVYMLRELGGLSYREIAEACELTEESVRSYLYRARTAIREAYRDRSDRMGHGPRHHREE